MLYMPKWCRKRKVHKGDHVHLSIDSNFDSNGDMLTTVPELTRKGFEGTFERAKRKLFVAERTY